ncbi:MAG: DUF2950 domain-containing protein [Steroidobacteraceae bacterium]|nr:DUF2950 domain-containing protein [Steroidobacteraceae bacterium]
MRAWPGVAALTLLLVACSGRSATEQDAFATPEAAFEALVVHLEKGDDARLARLLGPGVDELLRSGDAVQDAADAADFVAAYRARHLLEADGDTRRTLLVGTDEWPLPIPAVQRAGKWYLDGNAGADELVYRRIGANELGALDVLAGFVEAQQEYAAEGHDGDPPGIYALKLISDPGLQNGLYWETDEDEPESPAGAFVAAAAAEGYRAAAGVPYQGYRYRMLYRQGANADGGAREYFADGLLTRGFALLAWPAEYGVSGVMTFVINQDGVPFQKDLGEATAESVAGVTAFDPDPTWRPSSKRDERSVTER